MSPDDARIDALRRFGPPVQIREQGYDVCGAGWCDALVADIRFGVRLLVKNKAFTAVTVLTLALGVGANTAIFSLIHGIILRPLPYTDPGQIVVLHQRMARVGVDDLLFSVKISSAAKATGAEVYFERTPGMAAARVKEKQPSLVIFDLNSAKLDPLGVIAQLKADPLTRGIKTLGFVSHVQSETIAAAKEAGIDEVLARSAFADRLGEILKA